jgi:transposase
MWVIEELVPDGLWERIAPLLPPPKPRRYRHPGRRRIDDRAALAGIVFVLKTGITWNQLPTSLVGCSGVTCWRRLRDWTEAGAARAAVGSATRAW